MQRQRVGTFGVWAEKTSLDMEAARELEALGYGTIWIGRSPGGDLAIARQLLDATESIVIATGIVNMWADDAASIATAYHVIAAAHPDRFLLGVGIGHPEATGGYRKPYASMVDYLDTLDAHGVPVADRALAALGPRALALARDRTLGAHPYLTTPEHTAQARGIMGPDALLAPEQKVVASTDSAVGRALGRARVANPYLSLTNYLASLRRLGYTDDDLADEGSDRLIDALVAHGDPASVASQVREHLDTGADHVALQVLGASRSDIRESYRQLADALGLRAP